MSKKVAICIDGYKQVYDAKALLLTTDKIYAHDTNVNTKKREYVRPQEYKLAVCGQKTEVLLPANSVTVIEF